MSLVFLLLILMLGFLAPVSVNEESSSVVVEVVSAEGTPGAGWSAYPGCAVQPRTEVEMDAIRATPAASVDPVATVTGQAVTPIDEETRAAIEMVIQMADSCAESGDFDRLAALYSPIAIQNGVFDAEPVVIEPGTPVASPSVAQPDPTKFGPAVVRAGWWIDGDHVVVEVERGNSIRQLRMVTMDGAWLIDSEETATGEMVDDGAESAGTPDTSLVLPIEVMQAIADLVVMDDGAGSTAALTIVSAEVVDWPDTFLGCPVDGAFAAQVITPGYRVVVEYEGERIEVHTDMTGHAVAC
jgi:hypothetical protein